VRILIDKNHAYEAENHVLFDVKGWKNAEGEAEYGKLSRRPLDEMIAGARVEVAPYKRDPMDFVLWKPSSAEEPGWESPWGRGRPGWHLECSAMSEKHLGKTFDIHGGGVDLVFPHNENEIAQSRCAHGTEVMANYWMHNGFLQVEGRKMAKSEGNFVTINDLLHTDKFGGRKWPGEVLRMAMLMTHYRQPIDFSLAKLEEAERILKRWRNSLTHGSVDEAVLPDDKPPTEFISALLDDLNTPEAIAEMHKVANKGRYDQLRSALNFMGFSAKRESLARHFVLESGHYPYTGQPLRSSVSETLERIKQLVDARNAARAAKNWAEADRIRDELDAMGIQLKDSKDPVTDEMVTTPEVKR